ncbi:MAG: T9SS type A sorting domain-containing protein [Ignavibacteriaceae bacterium]
MEKIKKIILISLFAVSYTAAQVDTTDWFPMQTGNYWEYMAWTIMGPKYFSIKVVGDTLMPNEKNYSIFYKKYFDTSSDFIWYFRKDSNAVLSYTGISSLFPSGEFKYLDFIKPDSTIWLIIPIYNCCNPNSRGISSTYNDNTYYDFLNKTNEAKQFEDVYVDSVNTIWTPSDGSFPIVLNRGLGIVWHFIFNDGSYYLQGALINGVKMGVITDINKEDNNIPISFSLQSYPNPFNSRTNFIINLPVSDYTELSLYNILGQKIATLIDEYKSAGNYNIQFNANHLSSGVYLAVLKQNKFTVKEKIILLK